MIISSHFGCSSSVSIVREFELRKVDLNTGKISFETFFKDPLTQSNPTPLSSTSKSNMIISSHFGCSSSVNIVREFELT